MNSIDIIGGVILIISTFYLIHGIIHGKIKYGYKYYGKGISADKNKNPGLYWLGIIIYGTIATTSLSVILLT